ncbi:MAG: ABC transporter permease [Propionibacteriaceae bacterium]|nr:ABC transporter permease [Propionibacteriaceae bacterium]
MTSILTLLRRNLTLFWRDKLSLLFALVSPIVMFLLFFLFFRNMAADLVVATVGGGITRSDAYVVCDAWMFASVASLATFSSSLGMLTAFVEDRVTGRFSDYLVTPVQRWKVAVAYVLATVIASFVLSTILTAFGQAWAWFHDEPLMSFQQLVACMGAVLVSCLVFCSFNIFLATFTATQGAYSGYSVLMGTALGFLSFCYAPPTELSDRLVSILSVLPFAQAASIIRHPAMEPSLSNLLNRIPAGSLHDSAHDTIMHALGGQLSLNGQILGTPTMFGILLGLAVVLGALTSWRLGRVIR